MLNVYLLLCIMWNAGVGVYMHKSQIGRATSHEPECDYPNVIMSIPIINTYVTVDLYAYPSLSYII